MINSKELPNIVELSSLIFHRNHIYQLLASGQHAPAIHEMLLLSYCLHPVDQGEADCKALITQLRKAHRIITHDLVGKNYSHTNAIRTAFFRRGEAYFYELFRDLQIILWKKGYLPRPSSEFWDPSRGRKSGDPRR
ncbi:hypothetical protein ES703_44110 [subsurface metagenome]